MSTYNLERQTNIENNIDPKRIDLRALGDKTDVRPIDRVDLIFLDKSELL